MRPTVTGFRKRFRKPRSKSVCAFVTSGALIELRFRGVTCATSFAAIRAETFLTNARTASSSDSPAHT